MLQYKNKSQKPNDRRGKKKQQNHHIVLKSEAEHIQWVATEWKCYMNRTPWLYPTRMERTNEPTSRLVREFESNETCFRNRHFECAVCGSDDTLFLLLYLRQYLSFLVFHSFIHPFQVLSFDKHYHKHWGCKKHCIHNIIFIVGRFCFHGRLRATEPNERKTKYRKNVIEHIDGDELERCSCSNIARFFVLFVWSINNGTLLWW